MATPEKNPEPSRSIADGAELEAAYRAMREPVSPGNLPAAIWTLWARLERAEEALAASEPHTEIKRLRSIIAAALERVELLDGGENDGREAEAILKEGLDESKSHTPQLESRDSVVTGLAIQHPCNCGAAEDQDCRSIGCSGAQIRRLNMLNKRIATTNDAYHTGAVDVDDPVLPQPESAGRVSPAGHRWEPVYRDNILVAYRCGDCNCTPIEAMRDDLTTEPCRSPSARYAPDLTPSPSGSSWDSRPLPDGGREIKVVFTRCDLEAMSPDQHADLKRAGELLERAFRGGELREVVRESPRHLPQFTKDANLNWVLSCTCGFTGAADGYATLSNARRAFSTHVGSRPTVT